MVENALEVTSAVVHALHYFLDVGKDLGMGPLQLVIPVIDRINKAMTEGASPETVGNNLGKIGVVGGSHPVRKNPAAFFRFDLADLGTEEGGRLDDLPRVGVFILVVVRQLEFLLGGFFYLVPVEVAEEITHLAIDPSEQPPLGLGFFRLVLALEPLCHLRVGLLGLL